MLAFDKATAGILSRSFKSLMFQSCKTSLSCFLPLRHDSCSLIKTHVSLKFTQQHKHNDVASVSAVFKGFVFGYVDWLFPESL